MNDYDDFPESPEDYYESGYAKDQYYQAAQGDVKGLFESNKEGVYYIRQFQVRFEKKYFHWITNNAV